MVTEFSGKFSGFKQAVFEASDGAKLLRHLLDVEIVLGVGDFDLFFDEAFVDLAKQIVDHASA